MDVEIGASASARAMTFTKQPRTHVESRIESADGSRSTSSRHNLPDHVEAGETYRDVEVGYRVCPKPAEGSAGQPPDPASGEQEQPDTTSDE